MTLTIDADYVWKCPNIFRTAAPVVVKCRTSEQDALEGLFQSLVCVATDASVGRKAGQYIRRYRKSHAVELGDETITAEWR